MLSLFYKLSSVSSNTILSSRHALRPCQALFFKTIDNQSVSETTSYTQMKMMEGMTRTWSRVRSIIRDRFKGIDYQNEVQDNMIRSIEFTSENDVLPPYSVITTCDHLVDKPFSEKDALKMYLTTWAFYMTNIVNIILDDILDRSDLRYGNPALYTLPHVQNKATAYLSMTAVLARHLVEVAMEGEAAAEEVIRLVTDSMVRVMIYQMQIIAPTKRLDLKWHSKARLIHRMKHIDNGGFLNPMIAGLHVAGVKDPQVTDC